MNQEQENLLFQAIGEIQGSQAAILNDLKETLKPTFIKASKRAKRVKRNNRRLKA